MQARLTTVCLLSWVEPWLMKFYRAHVSRVGIWIPMMPCCDRQLKPVNERCDNTLWVADVQTWASTQAHSHRCKLQGVRLSRCHAADSHTTLPAVHTI